MISTLSLFFHSSFHKSQFLSISRYSTGTVNNGIDNLSPWWITGITDAEGNFSINFNAKTQKIHASFKVTQKSHSNIILLGIQRYFNGVGLVCVDNNKYNAEKFVVNKLEDLVEKILPHFDKYPLASSKQLDYLDFKRAVNLFKDGSGTKNKDLILYIKQGMNKNRSFENRWNYFTNIPSLEPEWVQAFIEGEGSFQFLMSNTVNRGRPYFQVYSRLEIAQSSHDIKLLAGIQKFFNLGYLKPIYDITSLESAKNSRSVSRYIITQNSVVISFINKYPLFTQKSLDYECWKNLIEMKNNGTHKTLDGKLQMFKVMNEMNRIKT